MRIKLVELNIHNLYHNYISEFDYMSEEIVTEKSFLQIKSIRTSSNAFLMKLKEGDVIIALDGDFVHKSYEELSKELSVNKRKKSNYTT